MQTTAIRARMTLIVIAGIISCLASAICVAQTSPTTATGDVNAGRVGSREVLEPLTEMKIGGSVYRVRKVLVKVPDGVSGTKEQRERLEQYNKTRVSTRDSSRFVYPGNAAFCITRQFPGEQEQCLALTPWAAMPSIVRPRDEIMSRLHLLNGTVVAVIVVHMPTPTNVDVAILEAPSEGGKSIGKFPECVTDSLGFVRDPVGRRGVWKGMFGTIIGQLIGDVAVDFDDTGCRITVKDWVAEGDKALGEVRFLYKDNTWHASGDLRTQYASDRVPPKDETK